jgi:DNA-binding transcriptional MocR family regulator
LYTAGPPGHPRAADIATAVEDAVRDGRLGPGDRLPPVRRLAAALGVSPATAAAAYRELGRRGIVLGEGRSGTSVAPRPPVHGGLATLVPRGLKDLAHGAPDPSLLPDWTDLVDSIPRRSRLYGETTLEPDLVDLARERLRADSLDATHVTVVSGALDGIERVLGAHLRAGDAVAVEDPVYPSVIDLLRAMALRPLAVRVDARGLLADDLDRALSRGARAVVMTPRSQNPFGSSLDDLRRTELRRALARHPEVLVVEDDHAERVGGGAVVGVAPPGMARWAVIRSVSKTLGPDLRLAVICGDESTIARVAGRLAVGPGWVSHILQRMVIELWSRPGLDVLLGHAAATYRERREALVDALVRRGFSAQAASGFNVWVPVEAETSMLGVLAEAGYAALPGERFRLTTPPAIRITCSRLDPAEAEEVAEAMASAGAPGATRLA